MNKKTKLWALSFVILTPFSTKLVNKEMVSLNAEEIVEINDELNDFSKVNDYYNTNTTNGDVGFGAEDSRVVTTYQATKAPDSSTMWDNYGYLQYTLSGQNLLTVVTDEATKCPTPLVFASEVIEVSKVEEEKSSNWTRRTYSYILPTSAEWVRILISSYNAEDESIYTWSQQITRVNIKHVDEKDLPGKEEPTAPITIEDELNDFSKVNDHYNTNTTNGDVGFGAEDSRVVTTYQATKAPDSSTMWDNYGYLQYTLSGQNLLIVVTDEATKCPAPLVFASGVVEVSKVEEETSSNWTRRTYSYILSEEATWVRILISSYNAEDESIAYWSQQITKVTIKKVDEKDLPKKDEPVTPPAFEKIEDNLDDFSKTKDFYGVILQSTDVGFGIDNRYASTKSPLTTVNNDNWWESDRAYLEYAANGVNLVKVVVDADPSILKYLPHIVLAVNYGTDTKLTEVNNYEVESSANWSRITYTFVLDENASWLRVVYSIYNSYDNKLQSWMQQVTKVVLDHVDELPAKGEVPTIEEIKKPEIVDAPTIEDDCSVLEINDFYSDFYRTNSTNGKIVSFAEGTCEYTEDTWWEATNGYVQIKLNGQNLITVNALVEEKTYKYINPLGLYAGNGSTFNRVNVNNVINNGVEDGYVKCTYVYVLDGQTTARFVFTSYNSPDGLITPSSQQIDHIKAEYVTIDKLPAADVVDTSHDESKKAIDDYVSTLSKDAYTTSNWDYIIYYANRAKHELSTSTNDEEIINKAKENINSIKTIAQVANEEKEKEINDFNSFFNDLDQSKYTSENWAIISSLYNDAINEIESVTDINHVKQILADTKDDILRVEEISEIISEQPSSEPSSEPSNVSSSEQTISSDNEEPHPTSKGCKGVATTSLISLLLVLGIALKSKKR